MTTIGDRVGAVQCANNGVVKLFGFGVRIADKVPPADAIGFGSILYEAGIPNPCILLDDGKEVFGCECWWGPEDKIKSMYADWAVETVDIAKKRAEVKVEHEAN